MGARVQARRRARIGLSSCLALVAFGTTSAWADAIPQLQSLVESQAKVVLETFAADTAFRPVEGPSSYGRFWGVSAGVIGIATSPKKLEDALGIQNAPWIPGGDLFVGLQAPLGFGAEFGFLPKLNINGLRASKFGGDLKWNADAVVGPLLPVDLAIRAMLTSTTIDFDQVIQGISGSVGVKSTVWGLNASVGRRFFYVLEPYLGLGYIHQTGKVSAAGSIPVFDTTLTAADSWEYSSSSLWFYGGLQLRLLVPTFSVQYDSVFGVNTISAKLAVKF